MPQGLQVLNENGTVTLDVSERLTRVIGSFYANGSNGAITDWNVANGGTFWYIVFPAIDVAWVDAMLPVVTASGATISWTYEWGANVNAPATILYGVY